MSTGLEIQLRMGRAAFLSQELLNKAVMSITESATANSGLCPKCLTPFTKKHREPVDGGGELWAAHCRQCDSTYML